MQPETNDSKARAGRREFIKSAGVAAAGMYLAAQPFSAAQAAPAAAKNETLALNGGPKAVTLPAGHATRWPIYGQVEEKEVVALLRNPSYGPITDFEKAWAEFHQIKYCKAHCNGTSALTSMLFALDLPPGSEVLVSDFSTFFPVVPMRLFDLVPVFVDINPKTLNIDIEDCKRKLTKNTPRLCPCIGMACRAIWTTFATSPRNMASTWSRIPATRTAPR